MSNLALAAPPLPIIPKAEVPADTQAGAAAVAARKAWFLRIVQDSADVADRAAKAGFGAAQPIWFETVASAIFAEPIVSGNGSGLGARVLEVPNVTDDHPPAGNRQVAIVPILAEDANLLWVRQWFAKGGSFARYAHEGHTIFVRCDNEMTATWLGIAVLHEAWHAREWITRQYDVTDPRVFTAEEMRTHIFQHELSFALGGQAYADALDRETERLKGAGTRFEELSSGKIRVYTAPRAGNYEASLVPIFGAHRSTYETDFRATSFHLEATMQALHDDRAIRTFMQSVYVTTGALPESADLVRGKISAEEARAGAAKKP